MAVAGHTLLDYHYLGRLSTIRGTIKRHMKFNNHNQLIGQKQEINYNNWFNNNHSLY